MFLCNILLSLCVCQAALFKMYALGSMCNPANYICSGRCPPVPPKLELPNGVAICMRHSNTKACVCWLDGESNHIQSWFRCEAIVNGTITDINCQAPVHCFPRDSDPTCLVIPYCDCRLLKEEDSPAFQYGNWRPVRADVHLPERLDYSMEMEEFSIKHLLFLLSFVFVPLACWCLLNFVNENKCKRKNVSASLLESAPINPDRTMDQNVAQPSSISQSGIRPTERNTSLQLLSQPSLSLSCEQNVLSAPLTTDFEKLDIPPSYNEATNHDSDEDGPPPSYIDAVQLYDSSI